MRYGHSGRKSYTCAGKMRNNVHHFCKTHHKENVDEGHCTMHPAGGYYQD